MEGKPTKIHHVPLNLSLADLHSLLRTKIVSIGEPLYDKAYILFGKPRNGVTLASLGKTLRRFEMHIRKKAQAALFIKVCKGHFDDNFYLNIPYIDKTKKFILFKKTLTD